MNIEQMNAAKESMIDWLSHPNELGKPPAMIECAGTFDLHEMHYYIFKFKKRKLGAWLLGVCGGYVNDELENCGHVFSDMQEYYEKTAVIQATGMVEMIRSYWMNEAKKAEAEDTQWIRENQEEKVLLTGKLFQKPPLLQRMVILSVMERLCGKRKDITRIHVESVRKLYDHPVRKRVSLGYGMQAVRNYTNIEIFIENPRRESNGKGKKREEFIYLQDSLDLKWHDFSIQTAVTPYRGQRIVEKTYTKWLDYDKIKQNAVFRTRRSGDYLVINASGGRKKLKDYLIDNKIPQKERDSLLLLAQGSEVLWVVGYRMGESAKISENTKQMIEVHIGGNTNE